MCLHAIWLRKELLAELDSKEQRWRGPVVGRLIPRKSTTPPEITSRRELMNTTRCFWRMFAAQNMIFIMICHPEACPKTSGLTPVNTDKIPRDD